eukprot:6148941-Amphidinium_carterae.1
MPQHMMELPRYALQKLYRYGKSKQAVPGDIRPASIRHPRLSVQPATLDEHLTGVCPRCNIHI